MNLFEPEYDDTEMAIWETVKCINDLDNIQAELDSDFDKVRNMLKQLQNQLLQSQRFITTEKENHNDRGAEN